MIKTFGNIEVELTGSLLRIRKDGELLKSELCRPYDAVDQFKLTCKRVESYLAQ
jgi:hypothetical protein